MNKKVAWVSFLIAIYFIVLTPSIVLLWSSSWNADEYIQAWQYKTDGFEALWNRLLHWSPRPFSDGVLYVYYQIVAWQKDLVIVPFLATLWGILGLSLYVGLRNLIKDFSGYFSPSKSSLKIYRLYLKVLLPLLLTLVLLVYFVFIEKPTEIFYWPAGAAPYLLSLSGIILSVFTFIRLSSFSNISVSDVFVLLVLAIVTAFSSEVGAVFQLLFSISLLLTLAVSKINSGFQELPFSNFDKSSFRKLLITIIISIILSCFILFLLKNSRVGNAELNSLSSPITSDVKISFVLAMLQFFKEISSLNNIYFQVDSSFTSLTYSALCKLGFLLLVTLLFVQAKISLTKPAKYACLISIFPLLASNFTMLVATYYQFGEICCERHLHFRSILTGLVILLIGIVLASQVSSRKISPEISIQSSQPLLANSFFKSETSLLMVSFLTLILLINLQIDGIKNDLYNFRTILHHNRENWSNNLSNKSSSGEYINPPTTQYVSRFSLQPGTYSISQSNLGWQAQGYINYFNKKELIVKE